RQLPRGFLGALAPLHAQHVSVGAERLRHARTEAVGLDDEADECRQVVDAVALAEGAERFLPGAAVAELARDLRELFTERIVHRRALFADARDRRREAETGLEADDHEVEA